MVKTKKINQVSIDNNICPKCNRPYYYGQQIQKKKKTLGFSYWLWPIYLVIIILIAIWIIGFSGLFFKPYAYLAYNIINPSRV